MAFVKKKALKEHGQNHLTFLNRLADSPCLDDD